MQKFYDNISKEAYPTASDYTKKLSNDIIILFAHRILFKLRWYTFYLHSIST